MRKRFGDDRLANVVAMETASRLMYHQVLERLKAIATGQNIDELVKQAEPEVPVPAEPSVEPENPASNAEDNQAPTETKAETSQDSAEAKNEEEVKE
jgi:ribosomal protein L12E/L44/L45/RPP1/RPP2